MHPAGPARKGEIPLQITIGTIPLKSMFASYNDAAKRVGYETPGGMTPNAPPVAPSAPPTHYPPPDARELLVLVLIHGLWPLITVLIR